MKTSFQPIASQRDTVWCDRADCARFAHDCTRSMTSEALDNANGPGGLGLKRISSTPDCFTINPEP